MPCVLERAGSITSAGRYLLDLSRWTERRELAIGPMPLSLAKKAGSSAIIEWLDRSDSGKLPLFRCRYECKMQLEYMVNVW